MNRFYMRYRYIVQLAIVFSLILLSPILSAQTFDFEQLSKKISQYTVIVDIKIEVSFGMHSTEQKNRLLGTIVGDDGLIIFNGASLSSDAAVSSLAGVNVKTSPKSIEVTFFDGRKYKAEFVGTDRFTRIGFARIIDPDQTFKPISFEPGSQFKIGSWVALYTLLPEFITPPVATDIGMLSAIVESPEYFPLTVGFNNMQLTSVLYDEALQPVGVLGALMDPSAATSDMSGMLESFSQFGSSVLGVVTSDRLARMISDPPTKGEIDRGWLGITLQALTPEIAEFWGIDLPGGIIINDIVDNSPAAEGGLEVGDIIYEVNGQAIEVDKEEKIPIFQRMISEMGPDATVEIASLRPTENEIDTLKLLVVLGKAPISATDAPEHEDENLELKVRNLVFSDYMFYQLDPASFTGVVVSELKAGGLSDVGGLELGDIIQRIDDYQITSVEDAQEALDQMAAAKTVEIIFFVWRDNNTLFINVKTDWE